MERRLGLLHVLLTILSLDVCIVYSQIVEQMHIAYGEDATSMRVTFSTRSIDPTSAVGCMYGQKKLTQQSSESFSEKFVQGDNAQYIHKVKLDNLKPGELYLYSCGFPSNMSDVYQFRAKRTDAAWQPSIALFGDMGAVNARSLVALTEDTVNGYYDAIFHVGDFAYNMESNNGHVGDAFMQNIQTIATQLPYMTCPGNHEQADNFTNYKRRFAMPSDIFGDRMFYSFDIGPLHVISLSTEYYFFFQYGFMQLINQYNWLKEDLDKAKANRKNVPWIMVMGHRPMYCSNLDHDDCTHYESLVRQGIPFIHLLSMEDLFYDYGVDLMFWAHEHSYERLWPVYNRKMYNGTKAPYTNPGAPVHIITGSAGCSEDHDKFAARSPWTAFRTEDYGYSRMKVYNSTHVYIEQVSDDKGGEVVDKIWVIKDHHGPYADQSLRFKPGKPHF